MSVKPVREYHGKAMVHRTLELEYRGVLVTPSLWGGDMNYQWEQLCLQNPWLLSEKLVVKPDQLIKRRGKAGLIKVNCGFEEVKDWIIGKLHKEVNVEGVSGILTHFLIEPFVAHKQEEEYYVCIQVRRSHLSDMFCVIQSYEDSSLLNSTLPWITSGG